MAEQGTLPRIFMRVSKRFSTPDFSIIFYGVAAILFSLWAGFYALAAASTLSRLVMYLLSALALPVLERRDEASTPWWHLPASITAVAATLWVASQAKVQSYQMLGLILLVGTVLFFVARRGQSTRQS